MAATNQFLGQYVPQVRENQGLTALDRALDTINERRAQRQLREEQARQFNDQQARLMQQAEMQAQTSRTVKGMDIDWNREKAKLDAQQKNREGLSKMLLDPSIAYRPPEILNKVASGYGADLNAPIDGDKPQVPADADAQMAPTMLDGGPGQASSKSLMSVIQGQKATMPEGEDLSGVDTSGALFEIRKQVAPRVLAKYQALVAQGRVNTKEALSLADQETNSIVKTIADQRRIDKPSGGGADDMAKIFISAAGLANRVGGDEVAERKDLVAYNDAVALSRTLSKYEQVLSDPQTTPEQRRAAAASAVDMWNQKLKSLSGATITPSEISRINMAAPIFSQISDAVDRNLNGGFSLDKARELRAASEALSSEFLKRIRTAEERKKQAFRSVTAAIPELKKRGEAYEAGGALDIIPKQQEQASGPQVGPGVDQNDPAYKKLLELRAKKAASMGGGK